MKRMFLLLPALAWLVLGCSQRSGDVTGEQLPDWSLAPEELIATDPTLAVNEMHPYICNADADTPAPSGYKPFYISHYGRHGSRTMHTDATLVKAMGILRPACEAGQLTEFGLRLYDSLLLVKRQTDGRVGQLTALGAAQQRGIGMRMGKRFPEVFSDDADISCRSTTIPRCIMSMSHFLMGLREVHPNLPLTMDTADSYTAWMNAKDRERTGAINRMVDAVYTLPDSAFNARVFRQLPAGGGKGLMNAVYRSLITGINLDRPVSCRDFFTDEEWMALWRRYNTREYMNCSNPEKFGGPRMRIFVPLIDTLVREADKAIAAGKPAADLRFGHDYPLMTVLSYFEPEGLITQLPMGAVNKRFMTVRWISMASNIQLVFYRKTGGDVLVKFLHNEGETLLQGLTPVTGPYYRWTDLKAALCAKTDRYREAGEQAF